MAFTCSICGEESTQICVRCTKDACVNHLCEKCRRCSDCCECELMLDEPARQPVRSVMGASTGARPEPPVPVEEPEPPVPVQAPEPIPGEDPEQTVQE